MEISKQFNRGYEMTHRSDYLLIATACLLIGIAVAWVGWM
jgi:hypothetical protein